MMIESNRLSSAKESSGSTFSSQSKSTSSVKSKASTTFSKVLHTSSDSPKKSGTRSSPKCNYMLTITYSCFVKSSERNHQVSAESL